MILILLAISILSCQGLRQTDEDLTTSSFLVLLWLLFLFVVSVWVHLVVAEQEEVSECL